MKEQEHILHNSKLQKEMQFLEERIHSSFWKDIRDKKKNEEKKILLLKTLEEVGIFELEILYYAKNISSVGIYSLLRSLKRLYKAQCDYKNKIENTNKYQDPF